MPLNTTDTDKRPSLVQTISVGSSPMFNDFHIGNITYLVIAVNIRLTKIDIQSNTDNVYDTRMTTTEHTALPKLFIREWAKHKGFDQKILAEKMDTTEATVSRLLSGQRKMTLEWLSAFSEVLGCMPADMFASPSGGHPPIRGAEQIRETLKRIEGLTEHDIQLHFELIMRDIKFNAAEHEQSQAGDQSQRATALHEPKP